MLRARRSPEGSVAGTVRPLIGEAVSGDHGGVDYGGHKLEGSELHIQAVTTGERTATIALGAEAERCCPSTQEPLERLQPT